MFYFFFILLHFISGQPLLNLYYTDLITENNDIFEHDCLRSISTNRYGGDVQMMSFCLSESASLFDIKDIEDEEISKFTFAQLSEKNITAEELYYWSAPIDTIENYQLYLNTKDLIFKEKMFYNCTLGRFGNRCQYEIRIFSEYALVYHNIHLYFEMLDYHSKTMTCYKHLECDRGSSLVCLDWRDICNGQIDCLNDGIDEKDCWELEIKECKENERRCLNGQCMPLLTSIKGLFRSTCLNKSPNTVSIISTSNSCQFTYNLLNGCDDIICSKNSLTSSCHRNHDSQLLFAMYSSEDGVLSTNCSLAFGCVLNSLLCTEFCQKNQCVRIVQDSCPEMFFYPHVPILFGNIYFGYLKKDLNSSMIMPYLCYNTTDYDDFFQHSQTFLFNHVRCMHVKEFYFRINQSNSSINTLDIIRDLKNTLKRYHLSMNYTTEICNRSSMYQCIGSRKCIHIFRMLDEIYDCPQMDDEIISRIKSTSIIKYIEKSYFKCHLDNKYIPDYLVNDLDCDCTTDENEYCEDEYSKVNYIKTNILFQHICDRFHELLPISIDGYNHTDETECQQWECNNIYTRCNYEWNCPHAEDETDCPSELSFRCSSNSHRCVSHQTNQLICLPTEKINDGFIDCLSATDEETIRNQSLFLDPPNRQAYFYCINQSSYSFISDLRLCDGNDDCQHGDDERFCTTDQKDLEYGICFMSNHQIISDVEKFFCKYGKPFRLWDIVPFKINSIDSDRRKIEYRSSSTKLSSESNDQCHLGLFVRVWLNRKNKSSIFTCFCPPYYYGSQCQYQNQRISLKLQFQTLSDSSKVLFIIIVSLIDDSDEKLIHSYESFTYSSVRDCDKFFSLTLHYSTRPKNATRKYFIRIDVYEKFTLYHRGSLLFPIEFPFLPVHHLGFLVDIPRNNTHIVDCKNRQCQHGRCMKYWNQLEGPSFCQCKKGWRGKYCQIPYHCQCSSDAICFDILSNNQSICLCPKNRLGTRCLIQNTICEKNINLACVNDGECIVTEDYNGLNDQFICHCKQGFSGERCENVDNQLIFSFDRQITLSQSIFIHFIYKNYKTLTRSTMFKTISTHQDFLTIYRSKPYHMAFIEFPNRHYYLGVISKDEYSSNSTINRTIQSSDRCPNITELFNETILQWHLIRRIKYYHLPCQNHSLNLSCFHDEVHLCLCYYFFGKYLANCFRFEHNQTYDCAGRSECEHNSRCLQDDPSCPKQSMCICNDCFYGRKCQLRTDQFSLSLDAILGYHILPINSFLSQPSIIKISLALTIGFISIGLINSILSILTFTNKSVREVGCGLYLLGTSITTILITIMFSLKFVILLLTHMTIITNQSFLKVQCYSIDFLIQVCLHLEQWLTACVACERVVTTYRGVQFVKRKSKQAAKKLIFILVIVIILSFIHDPLSRDLSNENHDEDIYEIKRTWCIVRYRSGFAIYNYIIHTFHFIGPFLINLISSILLIVKKSRQNAATIAHRSFIVVLREHFSKHKHLLIAPFVLVILAIPRLILVYTSKCMKSANDIWLYLLGYYISFIPSMLTFFIFILPSKFYKKELRKTITRYREIIRRKLSWTA